MSCRLIFTMLLAGLALPALVRADTVANLRATLGGLQAAQPIAATLKVNTTVTDEDSQTTHAQLQISVASGGDGLHLGFSPELLQRESKEAAVNAKNKDAPTPIRNLLEELSPIDVQPMVDYAPVLLRQIDGATLASEGDEAHDGKSTHLLVFDVPLPASASKQMTVKHYTGQIKVWLGADGAPVAVQNVIQIKGRKLLISIDIGNTTSYALKVIGTRLVAQSRRSEESHSVFGKSGSSVTEAVLTPVAQESGS